MLVNCPECSLQVSNKAISCPHCGYPFKPDKIRTSTKRKRLPNGFGQISRIKGNLRKPYRAMVTTETGANGRPICKLLKPEAYFTTYNEAYAALLKYNSNPFDLSEYMNVEELYKKWIEKRKALNLDLRNITFAWKYCSSVYKIPIRELRARHIIYCIEEGTAISRGESKYASETVRARIKELFNQLLDFAIEYDLVDRNVAKNIDVRKLAPPKQETVKLVHQILPPGKILEIEKDASTNDIAAMILIQCYTGLRPQELATLLVENINTENWSIIAGMKTESGKNRIIPIHEKIRGYVKRFIDRSDGKYLFEIHSYEKYKYEFKKYLPNQKPHDPRLHFVTSAKNSNMDEYAIKRIVGHKITDVTESVYTKRSVEWLHAELSKLALL